MEADVDLFFDDCKMNTNSILFHPDSLLYAIIDQKFFMLMNTVLSYEQAQTVY